MGEGGREGGVVEGGYQVFAGQAGAVGEEFGGGYAAVEEVYQEGDGVGGALDYGGAVADRWVDGDAVEEGHGVKARGGM
ncbi:hypothetical protein JMUB6875_43830 [Nocardia sp. JMUB6875]